VWVFVSEFEGMCESVSVFVCVRLIACVGECVSVTVCVRVLFVGVGFCVSVRISMCVSYVWVCVTDGS
jgi:hypothetical protein